MSDENGGTIDEEQNVPEENMEQPLADSAEHSEESDSSDSDEGLRKEVEAPVVDPGAIEALIEESSESQDKDISKVVDSLEAPIVEEAEKEASAMRDLVEDFTAESKADAEEEAAEELSDEVAGTEEEPDDGRAWYVVHCYSGYENKVRHNLEQRIESMGMKEGIFDVVVPTEEEIEVKDGKRKTVERRVFPGYILVNMVLSEESWYVVRNTPGVTSFVGQGNEPQALRPEEVATIIKRMEADAPRIKVTFKQGERVRIIDGPFNDFRGNVDEIDMDRAKVRVMVNFFGRETPVELDFLQVEKA